MAAERTVRELVLENPAATQIFEELGIDYCCGGDQTLERACAVADVPVERVAASLAATPAVAPDRDWPLEPLFDLIGHIKDTHHRYTRDEIRRLGPLFERVCSVHGKNHPELLEMRETFAGLAQELSMHMMKEEAVLFPYIVRMEEAVIAKEPVLPPPFGALRNPVTMMRHEHDSAGAALRAMREASRGYTASADACVSYQNLYKSLAAFEADLHRHIHLENNILFPRAMEMESKGA
ncbi:MAG TPA: iron-sulfur cluster repair di-iron protein [Bryobacteraceae bacterium]|nr:iron-sulfur cluster repair di-iron protein [Bryobacteraceae bacterium]